MKCSSGASSASKDESYLNMENLKLLQIKLSHQFQENFPRIGTENPVSPDFLSIMTNYYQLTLLITSIIFKENKIPLEKMKLKIPSGLGQGMDEILRELTTMFSTYELHKRRGEIIPKIANIPILLKYKDEIKKVEKQLMKSFKIKDAIFEKKTKIIELTQTLNLHLQVLQKKKDVKLFEDAFKLFYTFIIFLLSTSDKIINSFDDILEVDIQIKILMQEGCEFSILYNDKVNFEKKTKLTIDDFGFLMNSEFTEKEVKAILFISHYYWEKHNPSLVY